MSIDFVRDLPSFPNFVILSPKQQIPAVRFGGFRGGRRTLTIERQKARSRYSEPWDSFPFTIRGLPASSGGRSGSRRSGVRVSRGAGRRGRRTGVCRGRLRCARRCRRIGGRWHCYGRCGGSAGLTRRGSGIAAPISAAGCQQQGGQCGCTYRQRTDSAALAVVCVSVHRMTIPFFAAQTNGAA